MFSATTGCKRSQHGAERLDALQALRHPLLVAREPGHVEPVRAAHVERPLPVEVAEPGPLRLGHDRAQVESLPHDARERKRHPVGVGEAQVGEAVADRVAPCPRARVLRLEQPRQPIDARPSAARPRARRRRPPERTPRPSSCAPAPSRTGTATAAASAPPRAASRPRWRPGGRRAAPSPRPRPTRSATSRLQTSTGTRPSTTPARQPIHCATIPSVSMGASLSCGLPSLGILAR